MAHTTTSTGRSPTVSLLTPPLIAVNHAPDSRAVLPLLQATLISASARAARRASESPSDINDSSSVEGSPASVLSHFRSNSGSSATSVAHSSINFDTWSPPTVIYDREVIERWNQAVFGGPPESRFFTGSTERAGGFLNFMEAIEDDNKTVPKKYLYEGGVSSVLTGGVMLRDPEKIYVPVRNLAPRHRSNVVTKTPF